jgi:alpha-galactosidase
VSPRGRITFRGLDPDTRYRVDPVVVGAVPGLEPAAWWHADRVFSGQALEVVGVQAPLTFPETVVPFRVTAV